ncbi:MAG: xylose isomerase [Pirellulaceae bacterium]|nr:MAG: xylose isomerase [Pirellulaceae bacterium]
MLIGYNTNGWAHHRLEDAITILAEIGYRSVAISIDHGVLAPQSDWQRQADSVARLLEEFRMASVIETGARYLLDPRHKHQPTLVSVDPEARAVRRRLVEHAIRCAARLGSRCVSLWSGTALDRAPCEELWGRLVGELAKLCDYAERHQVVLGFEPEPGMFVATMRDFEQLLERIDHPRLGLTLDIGHLYCQNEEPIEAYIVRWAPRLVNVHIEDARRGVHEHLMFGEGEIDFRRVLAGFRQAQYAGPIHVELSRHSHEAPQAARQAFQFLMKLWNGSP